MIDRERSLYYLLLSAARMTDWAAQDLVAISLQPRKENLRKLVEAIASLFEVRDELLRGRPDLAPKDRLAESAQGTAIGPGDPVPQALQDYFELESAIDMLEGFAGGHNRELAAIAHEALPDLRARLRQFEADA